MIGIWEKKYVPAAACPKPFAVRFASIAIAAVLATSFIPLAAFADEGEPADEGVQNSSGQQTEGIQQGEQPEASTGEPAEAEGDRNLSTQVTATASTAAEGGGVSMRKGM